MNLLFRSGGRMSEFDVEGLARVATRLGDLAAELGHLPAVLAYCSDDGSGEGDPNLDPSSALMVMRTRWAGEIRAVQRNLGAGSSNFDDLANALSDLDDHTGL